MPYVVPGNSIAMFTFKGKHCGQDVMSSLHYRYVGTEIADGRDFLANFIGGNVQFQLVWAALIALTSNDVTEIETWGQWIFPTRYRKVIVTQADTAGTGGGSRTANVAQVVSLFADVAGRTGVANKHLFGLPDAAQRAGEIQPAQRVLLNTYGDAARTPCTVAGGNFMFPAIYHRAAPDSSKTATGYAVNPLVRVERRRTVGLGK